MSRNNRERVGVFLDSFQPRVDEFIKETPVAELGDIVHKLSGELKDRKFPLLVNPQVVDRTYQNGIVTLQNERALVKTRFGLVGYKKLKFFEDRPGLINNTHYFSLKSYDAEVLVQGTPDRVIISAEWGKRGQSTLQPISLVGKTRNK